MSKFKEEVIYFKEWWLDADWFDRFAMSMLIFGCGCCLLGMIGICGKIWELIK